METESKRLYIKWCQSDRIQLVVGPPSSETQKFLVPQELLRQRSRKFRELLDQHWAYNGHAAITVADTPVEVFEDFFVWTFSPQPQVKEQATFEEVAELGIFAWAYQLPALSNQVTDKIRGNLASGDWELQASIVDGIYLAAPAGSALREVIRGALGKLPRSSVEGGGQDENEWEATFKKHADLGWDYIKASGAEWAQKEYLAGVCRFHDHEDVPKERSSGRCDGCPYAQDDCYLSKEKLLNGLTNGVHDKINGEEEASPVIEEVPVADDPAPEETSVPEASENAVVKTPPSRAPEVPAAEKVLAQTNGTRKLPESVVNGSSTPQEADDAIDDANGTVTSEDGLDEGSVLPAMQTIGTTTEEPKEDVPVEKAADEANGPQKKKNKKKKKNSVSTAAVVA